MDAGLLARYQDSIAALDHFPYLDDARKKPNAGQVLYLLLPPRGDGDEQRARALFDWTIQD